MENPMKQQGCTIPMLCRECIPGVKKLCEKHEDTPPRECRLIQYYSQIARKELPPEYQVFIRFDELYCTFFLTKRGIVVEECTHPKTFIGLILLRKMNPEWFHDE